MDHFRKTRNRSLSCGDHHREGDNKPCYVLHLYIRKATNVDQLIGPFVPSTKPAYYQVVVSKVTATDDDDDGRNVEVKQWGTEIVRGMPEPSWGCGMKMKFDEFPAGESFFLEVLSLGSNHDPGTSSGVAVVGRAQIMVPTESRDFGKRRHELVTLTGAEKKVEGFIHLDMNLGVKWRRRRNPAKRYRNDTDCS